MTTTMMTLLIYKEKGGGVRSTYVEPLQRHAQGSMDKLRGYKPAREKAQWQELGSTGLLPHTEGTQEAAGSPLCGFFLCHK